MYESEKPLKNGCINNMCHMFILVKSKNNYSQFSTYFLIFLILPCSLTMKVRGLIRKVGLGTCITLPYLTSKGQIIESLLSILDKNSPIGILPKVAISSKDRRCQIFRKWDVYPSPPFMPPLSSTIKWKIFVICYIFQKFLFSNICFKYSVSFLNWLFF